MATQNNKNRNSGNKQGRGPNPTPLTIHMLCAHAAGRCEFEGCGRLLFTDSITLDDFNNTNVAHIVASSPTGPRGDKNRSHKLSQDIDNLMLMCMDHHKLIDSYPEIYTEDILLKMKKRHEQSVQELCAAINAESTEIIMLTSPVKGKIDANIDFRQTIEAIRFQRKPASNHGILINVEASADYKSRTYWDEVQKQLERKFDYMVRSILSMQPDMHFSVFPIAPIPLIAKLGFLMGDKIQANIYQKSRSPDTWCWQSTDKTNEFLISKEIIRPGNRVALALCLTANIAPERIIDVFDADVIYKIHPTRYGVDCILSIADLSCFWHQYQVILDEIRNTYLDVKDIGVFPAIPISAAFEIGRRYMPVIYPSLRIYDDDNGFFEALTLGG